MKIKALSLAKKRKIVQMFKGGKSMVYIQVKGLVDFEDEAEGVIRDFMNGKFTLEGKRGPKA